MHRGQRFLLLVLIANVFVEHCQCFYHDFKTSGMRAKSALNRPMLVCWNQKEDKCSPGRDALEQGDPGDVSYSGVTRRHIVATSSLLISVSLAGPRPSLAATVDKGQYLNCLSDLPSKPANYVRLYLCRHGQTENNRLGTVQGARADVEINEMGIQQARRMGKALARAEIVPSAFVHSPLKRTFQTASFAAQQLKAKPPITELDAIGEVDFGPTLEGRPVVEMRAQMYAAYGRWSMGDIDSRMSEGGESGRDILTRIGQTMEVLVQQASTTPSQSIAAVAHSVYLRMLLATVQDIPLAQVSTLKQRNACINVLDVPVDFRSNTMTLTASSSLIGGPLSRAPSDWRLDVPSAIVLRVNENRHLLGLD